MRNWICYVEDGRGNAHRVEVVSAESAVVAVSRVLSERPWLVASDVVGVVEESLLGGICLGAIKDNSVQGPRSVDLAVEVDGWGKQGIVRPC